MHPGQSFWSLKWVLSNGTGFHNQNFPPSVCPFDARLYWYSLDFASKLFFLLLDSTNMLIEPKNKKHENEQIDCRLLWQTVEPSITSFNLLQLSEGIDLRKWKQACLAFLRYQWFHWFPNFLSLVETKTERLVCLNICLLLDFLKSFYTIYADNVSGIQYNAKVPELDLVMQC